MLQNGRAISLLYALRLWRAGHAVTRQTYTFKVLTRAMPQQALITQILTIRSDSVTQKRRQEQPKKSCFDVAQVPAFHSIHDTHISFNTVVTMRTHFLKVKK
jgi:hypothetical protein